MHDKSYAHRGHFPKDAFEVIERLLRNPRFRERLHTRTAQVSNAVRVAVAVGLEELERQYLNTPEKKTDESSSD